MPASRICSLCLRPCSRPSVGRRLAQGKSGEDIAAHLGIGIDTVKAHTKGINKKLGTAKQVDVALLALPPL